LKGPLEGLLKDSRREDNPKKMKTTMIAQRRGRR
jgi:hypothetical protein